MEHVKVSNFNQVQQKQIMHNPTKQGPPQNKNVGLLLEKESFPLKWRRSKVSGPKVGQIQATYLKWTTICERFVIRCESKNGRQKNTFLKEIGVWAQNMSTILDIYNNQQFNYLRERREETM